jgi:hypothetical protein
MASAVGGPGIFTVIASTPHYRKIVSRPAGARKLTISWAARQSCGVTSAGVRAALPD